MTRTATLFGMAMAVVWATPSAVHARTALLNGTIQARAPLEVVPGTFAESAAPKAPVSAASTWQMNDLSSAALFPAAEAFPANIEAPPAIAALMRQMWTISPTFRRQCARIAHATNGRIAIALRKPRAPDRRAESLIEQQRAGAWLAHVDVFLDRDLVEMIAHELEHVIEQIDGLDLPRLAHQGLAGVTAGTGGEHYETVRAVAAGKRVAAEYAGSRERSVS